MSAEDSIGLLKVMGLAYKGIVEKQLEKLPNNAFLREGEEIYYKNPEGSVREIFNLGELEEKRLSIDGVFNSDGIVRFTKNDGETVFLTYTPEENWIRIWVPLKKEETYTVRNLLRYYGGLQSVPFEEVATMPIQIGGIKARELREKAVYFELNLREFGIAERFPVENPLVKKFAANDFGQVMAQRKLI